MFKAFLLACLLSTLGYAASPNPNNYGASVFSQPISSYIERRVGASIVIANVGGSSLVGASIISVRPEVWMTNSGSSAVSFAAERVAMGPGMNVFVPGQTNLFGGCLTIPWGLTFHAPSIYPAYGSSVQVGTQTYSVSASILMSDGTYIYPTKQTITILPLPLPDAQVTGWH